MSGLSVVSVSAVCPLAHAAMVAAMTAAVKIAANFFIRITSMLQIMFCLYKYVFLGIADSFS